MRSFDGLFALRETSFASADEARFKEDAKDMDYCFFNIRQGGLLFASLPLKRTSCITLFVGRHSIKNEYCLYS